MQTTLAKIPTHFVNAQMAAVPAGSSQSAAFENLQAAILRLASKPPVRSSTSARIELRELIGQALEAYREYMRIQTAELPNLPK